jgi:GTP-binding protein
MKINSAHIVAQVHFEDILPETDTKHVAFIGRSNVGKSSLINAFTGKKKLALSSASPGHTKTINFFLINKSFYLVDLPGYGFAQGSLDARKKLQQLIEWYLTYPDLNRKQIIVLIIDAKVGVTELDRQMLHLLMEEDKKVVVVANKIDKVKKNDLKKQIDDIENEAHPYPVIPVSTIDKTGIPALTKQLHSFIG